MKIPELKKKDIAKYVGVSRQTILDFETGKRDTSDHNKKKIKEILNIKIQEIQKYINKIS